MDGARSIGSVVLIEPSWASFITTVGMLSLVATTVCAFELWRRTFRVEAALALTFVSAVALTILAGEALSALGQFNVPVVRGLVWSSGALSALVLTRTGFPGTRAFKKKVWSLALSSRFAMTGVGALAVGGALTGLTGLLTAPNNLDSLAYHLPRMRQWLQQGSLEHFDTPYEAQNYLAPGAELMTATIWSATLADRFLFLTQWGAWATIVITVFAAARNLGAARETALLGAISAGFAPALIGQASTTQNDLIATALVTGALYFCTTPVRLAALSRADMTQVVAPMVFVGAALAVKPPVALFGAPVAVWALGRAARRSSRGAVPALALALTFVLALNIGWMARNQQHHAKLTGPDLGLTVTGHHGAALIMNSIKNFGHVFAVPAPAQVNEQISKTIGVAAAAATSRDVDDPSFSFSAPYTVDAERNEDRPANPLQGVLVLITIGVALVGFRKNPRVACAAMTLIAGWSLFAAAIKYQTWGGRLMLPWITLGSVVAGAMWKRSWLRPTSWVVTALVLIQSIPWLVAQKWRPLVGSTSVVSTPRMHELTASLSEPERAQWMQALRTVRERNPESVALVGPHSYSLEYVWWSALSPHTGGTTISHQDHNAAADVIVAPFDADVRPSSGYRLVHSAFPRVWVKE